MLIERYAMMMGLNGDFIMRSTIRPKECITKAQSLDEHITGSMVLLLMHRERAVSNVMRTASDAQDDENVLCLKYTMSI